MKLDNYLIVLNDICDPKKSKFFISRENVRENNTSDQQKHLHT